MKRTDVFTRLAVGIESIVEPNRADGQFVTQTDPESIVHVIDAGFLGGRQEIAGIKEERALQLSQNWEGVFYIKDGVKLAANRIAFWVVRPKVALAVAADSSYSSSAAPGGKRRSR